MRYLPACSGLLLLLATGAVSADYDRGAAAYAAGDYETAYRLLEPMAEAGHPEAQLRVGAMHEWGQGVAPSFNKAAQWYQRAAAQGHPEAQFTMGFMYGSGTGVTQDEVHAWAWFDLAARQGDQKAREFRDATGARLGAGKVAEAQRLSARLRAD
ncbi:sel1 repeat family protein [Ectothiorhodospiraceae bacterium 2226]|nr:sel1 repeat family protein [Ectothiorhodospiraceae bacterium 2226]